LAAKLGSGGDVLYAMTFDKRQQLETWDTGRTSGTEARYDWDAAGNPASSGDGYDGELYSANGLNEIQPLSGGAFAYDADGNLADDGEWLYGYDAENRLVEMEAKSPVSGDYKLQFRYDYLSRRVEKKVWKRASGSWSYQASQSMKYVYRTGGHELLMEIDIGSESPRRSFHWGLDFSDTRRGAGGAMGLVMLRDYQGTDASYYPAYDMNGNVTGLLDGGGSFAAWYEYDAFGKEQTRGGAYAASNPIRFSTQYTDEETGLVYYGLRFYNPELGRFVNRDPIGEEGGANLYRFVDNDPSTRLDVLGLAYQLRCAETLEYEAFDYGTCGDSEPDCGDADYFSRIRTFTKCVRYELVWVNDGRDLSELQGDPNRRRGRPSPDRGGSLGGSRGGSPQGGGGDDPSPRKENEEDVDKELLKKLCASQAGRDLIDRINNENINIFSSETAFPSTRHLGFFDQTTFKNTGSVNIYVNRAVDTVQELRNVRYSGPGREGQALIIRHEIGEYDAYRNMPGEPAWKRDAHARWDTDQFARSAGFQPWFPGSNLQDLLDANAPSPSDPDGYSSRKVVRSDFEQMVADRIRITGFDCSRLNE